MSYMGRILSAIMRNCSNFKLVYYTMDVSAESIIAKECLELDNAITEAFK